MNILKYIAGALILLHFASCELVLNVDPPKHTPRLVVNCFLNNTADSILVDVSQSVGLLEEDKNRVIKNATVEIYENGVLKHEPVYVSTAQDYFAYRASVDGIIDGIGKTYEIRVKHPDLPDATASAEMPASVVPESVKYLPSASIDIQGNPISGVELILDDPVGIENYYEVYIIGLNPDGQGGLVSNPYGVWSDDTDVTSLGQAGTVIFNDRTFDGLKRKFILFNYNLADIVQNNGSALLVLKSITREKYLYGKSLDTQGGTQGNPFAEPASVFNGFEGGLGIFSLESEVSFPVEF